MKKKEIIKRINTITSEWGGFTIANVDGAESPILDKCGNDSEWLVEAVNNGSSFNNGLLLTKYVHGIEVDTDNITLTPDLKKELLEDILLIAESYEAEQMKTEKRCETW